MEDTNFGGAKHLAAWKKRVIAAWPGVRVEHIEARGVSDALEFGTVVSLRAVVALGDLAAEDVDVQVAYGRVDENDQIIAPTYSSLRLVRQARRRELGLRGRDDARPHRTIRIQRASASVGPLVGLAGRARTNRRCQPREKEWSPAISARP